MIATSGITVEMLKKHGFSSAFHESPGARTWIDWRNYLNEFARQPFRCSTWTDTGMTVNS